MYRRFSAKAGCAMRWLVAGSCSCRDQWGWLTLHCCATLPRFRIESVDTVIGWFDVWRAPALRRFRKMPEAWGGELQRPGGRALPDGAAARDQKRRRAAALHKGPHGIFPHFKARPRAAWGGVCPAWICREQDPRGACLCGSRRRCRSWVRRDRRRRHPPWRGRACRVLDRLR